MSKIKSVTICLAILVCSIVLVTSALAQAPSVWGDLKPGDHAIGFRTIEKYDYSRTFKSSRDYFGSEIPGETARPIQVCIWYPATTQENGYPMVYGEYAYPYPENTDFMPTLNALQDRELQVLFGFLNMNIGIVTDAMNIQFAAIKDAPPAEGKFPVIVYHPDARAGYAQNVVLCEYLASHGFIVVTGHVIGAGVINPQPNSAIELETQVRDREFLLTAIRDIPEADTRKVALIGGGAGGSAALIQQMRNYDIRALIGITPGFAYTDNISTVTANPFFDRTRSTVPMLIFYTNPDSTADLSVVDSLSYSDRNVFEFPGSGFRSFVSYALMAKMVVPPDSTTDNSGPSVYSAICRYTLNFCNGYLNDDPAGLAFVNADPASHDYKPDFISKTHLAPIERPPTRDEFLAVINDYGVAKAIELCEKFKLLNPDNPLLDGPTIIGVGYGFLQGGNSADALVILEWGVSTNPTSANAWDSYGEVLAASGNNKKAAECYRKALEILPKDTLINPGLAEEIRNGAPVIIQRLDSLIAAGNSSPTGGG